jgi:hypothetical protein
MSTAGSTWIREVYLKRLPDLLAHGVYHPHIGALLAEYQNIQRPRLALQVIEAAYVAGGPEIQVPELQAMLDEADALRDAALALA